MDVLKKINKLRLDRGWSVYRLSVESEISQSTLTNMFNRETLPSITTLECLCNAFGITVSDFFCEPEEKVIADDEQELSARYQMLSKDAKQSVLTILRELTKDK